MRLLLCCKLWQIIALLMLMVGPLLPGLAVAEADLPPVTVENSERHVVTAPQIGGRTYDILVRLPPRYDAAENAGRRYPVLYLTDGGYTFFTAAGTVRLPFNQNRLDHAILVGLPTANNEDGMVSRRRDLTPWDQPGSPSPGGGAAAYLEFIRQQVFPLIEGRYRADPARRILVGQSYGGLFGLWAALTEPGLFSGYLLTSPSLWYNKRALFDLEARIGPTLKDLPGRIYFATGGLERPGGCPTCTTDMVAQMNEMTRRLRARRWPGLTVRADTIAGTIHETTFPVGLVHGLMWLLPPRAG